MKLWETVVAKANPYLAWIKLAAAAIILAAAFAAGGKVEAWRCDAAQKQAVTDALKTQQERYATRDAENARQAKVDRDNLAAVSKELGTLEDQYDELARKAATAPLVRTVTKVIHENCECPVSNLSDAFRLCFNAAVSGATPTAVAACAAGGVPAGGQPR